MVHKLKSILSHLSVGFIGASLAFTIHATSAQESATTFEQIRIVDGEGNMRMMIGKLAPDPDSDPIFDLSKYGFYLYDANEKSRVEVSSSDEGETRIFLSGKDPSQPSLAIYSFAGRTSIDFLSGTGAGLASLRSNTEDEINFELLGYRESLRILMHVKDNLPRMILYDTMGNERFLFECSSSLGEDLCNFILRDEKAKQILRAPASD